MKTDAAGILVIIVIGIVAGWLASLVVGGGGLIKYLIWGLLGSAVGGYLLPAIGFPIRTGNAIVNRIITASIGAILVVLVARLIA